MYSTADAMLFVLGMIAVLVVYGLFKCSNGFVQDYDELREKEIKKRENRKKS